MIIKFPTYFQVYLSPFIYMNETIMSNVSSPTYFETAWELHITSNSIVRRSTIAGFGSFS